MPCTRLSTRYRFFAVAIFALSCLAYPQNALADCANPAGPEGRLVYNSTHKVVQYCDGTNWIGMGGGSGGGGASALVGLSDVDAGAAGNGYVLQYNTTTTKWEAVPLPAGVAGADTQIQFNDNGALAGAAQLFWDKTNNRLGVNVAAPTQAVDVIGKLTSDRLIFKSVSGAAAPLSGSTYWSSDGTHVWRATGNVGIGTTSPGVLLDVQAASGADAMIRARGDGNVSRLTLHNTGTSGREWSLSAYKNTLSPNGAFAIADETAAAVRMVIDASGNIGVGTTSPSSKLHVDAAGGLTISNGASGYYGWGMIAYANLPANDLDLARSGSPSVYRINHHTGLSFSAHTAYGGIRFYNQGYSGGDAYATYKSSAGAVLVASVDGSAFRVHTDASKPGGGSWQALSDARLKNIDGAYEQGLQSIIKLDTVRFHYKAGNPRNHPSDREFVGLVAQDVQKIFPEAVHQESDGFLTLDTTPINFAVINAIKELKAENDGLRADNDALRASNTKLEELNASILQRLDALEAHVMH
ncbi:MAG: tail fiber domain-containing protein [Hyphomicrobium sp.]|nr:tail fiber domain-containing protein [Hyphomicrobium sp.]